MIRVVPDDGRLIAGTSGSPGSLVALPNARPAARRYDVEILAGSAAPEGDLAERRSLSRCLRCIWADAAGERLSDAMDAGWGVVPPNVDLQPLVMRRPGPALVEMADSGDDLLAVGAWRDGKPTRIWRGKVSSQDPRLRGQRAAPGARAYRGRAGGHRACSWLPVQSVSADRHGHQRFLDDCWRLTAWRGSGRPFRAGNLRAG
jgi:hypothetical protein